MCIWSVGMASFGAVPQAMPHEPTKAVPQVDPHSEAKITGPNSVAAGQLAILIADCPNAQSMDWVIFPLTPNFYVDSSRRGAVLCGDGSVKEFTVMLATMTDGQLRMIQHLVVIGEKSPEPPPGPPQPPSPEPLDGLAGKIRDWTEALVDGPERVGEAKALASVYDSVVSQIVAGVLKDTDAIIKITFEKSREAIPRHVAWKLWGEKLRMQLNSNAKAGLLDTPEAHAVHWRAISKGLKAVK